MKTKSKITKVVREIWKSRYIYLLIGPLMAWLIIFCYVPMYGLVLAFKKYKGRLGIWGSEWIGLKNFKRIFVTQSSIDVLVVGASSKQGFLRYFLYFLLLPRKLSYVNFIHVFRDEYATQMKSQI